MNWTKIWLDLFGTTTLWGLDMGFWVAMAAVLLIVVLMGVLGHETSAAGIGQRTVTGI